MDDQKTFFESILTLSPPAKANKFPPSSNGFQLESFQAFDHAGSSVSLHPGNGMKSLSVSGTHALSSLRRTHAAGNCGAKADIWKQSANCMRPRQLGQ